MKITEPDKSFAQQHETFHMRRMQAKESVEGSYKRVKEKPAEASTFDNV